MSSIPEQVLNTAGLPKKDIAYRAGLVVQVMGAAALAVLYPLESPFYTVGIMLFEAGVLVSAISFTVRMRLVKFFVLLSVTLGLAMQAAGVFVVSEEFAGTFLLSGIGMVCAAAAGMAGKEAYCFGYREGWMLALAGFPVMAMANLFFREHRIFNSLGFSVLFLLLLSLAGKKLRQASGNQKDGCRQ